MPTRTAEDFLKILIGELVITNARLAAELEAARAVAIPQGPPEDPPSNG